jgi:hypothetical protein
MKVAQGCFDGSIEAYITGLPTLDRETISSICKPGMWYWNFTCNHAIGHGLLQARHYSLNQSLELCNWLEPSNHVFCQEGVFMEYTMAYTGQLMHHQGEDYAPVYTPERHVADLYYPCNSVPEPYAQSCWPYQDQIILYLNGQNYKDAFTKCSAIAVYNETCVTALSEIIAEKTFLDPRAASSYCDLTPSLRLHAVCIGGFVAYTLQSSADPADGLTVCRGIAKADKDMCYYSLGSQLTRMIGKTDVALACAQAEPSYVNLCKTGAYPPKL